MDSDNLFDNLEDTPGFYKHNNFHLVSEKRGEEVELKVELTENSLNPYGYAHGGLIFGLGDNAMGIIARGTGRYAVTLNANITYLKPATGKYLIAKAKIIKNGKSTSFLRCDIYNDKEILVASMDANYFYIDIK